MAKKVLLIFTLIALIWWFRLFFLKLQGTIENELWVVFFTFIPFIGAINGLLVSKKWGGWKSVFGKSILLISLGLLGWAIGNFIWSYFSLVQKIAVPYPSIADIFFFSIVMICIFPFSFHHNQPIKPLEQHKRKIRMR